jgi:aromatase
MTTSATRNVEHEVTVNAPAARVYELVADVSKWPQIFSPTVHVEYAEKGEDEERIRIWATANGTAKTWTSRRFRDPDRLTIGFRQEKSQHPVAEMGGTWMVQPLSATECRVRLLHDYRAATGDPADLEWIDKAVDRNSAAELGALKSNAESRGDDQVLTFDDTVEVNGSARDVYDFINEAQLWEERLPHVTRVSLEEETPGLQVLEMDTSTEDGSVHTTRSVRVCQPYQRIVYKQIVLPALMTLHTGQWLIADNGAGNVSVTSRHSVRINGSRITEVLGDSAGPSSAQAFVQRALSANSLATLHHAKSYAEGGGDRHPAP